METGAHGTPTPEGGRPSGETTGTPERPAQRVKGAALAFDLAAEGDRLRSEEAWRTGDRNATTLVNDRGLRIVLTALKVGGRIRAHRASASVAIQVVSGTMRVHLPDRPVEMPAGHVLVLEPGISHEVEAIAEGAFLVTLGAGTD